MNDFNDHPENEEEQELNDHIFHNQEPGVPRQDLTNQVESQKDSVCHNSPIEGFYEISPGGDVINIFSVYRISKISALDPERYHQRYGRTENAEHLKNHFFFTIHFNLNTTSQKPFYQVRGYTREEVELIRDKLLNYIGIHRMPY